MRHVRFHVEPTLGRHFLALLWNESHFDRFQPECYLNHFVSARGFEIESIARVRCESFDVGVLYVSPVLAKMRRYSVGARSQALHRRLEWTRLQSSAGLSHSRDMIDVYVEALMSCWHLSRPLGSQQLSWR